MFNVGVVINDLSGEMLFRIFFLIFLTLPAEETFRFYSNMVVKTWVTNVIGIIIRRFLPYSNRILLYYFIKKSILHIFYI